MRRWRSARCNCYSICRRSKHLPAPFPASPGTSYIVPVEGLYLHLEYIAGVGGGIYPSSEPYILLPDGAITDDLGYYPSSSADSSNWRHRKPRAWGRYTKNGATLSMQWDDLRRKLETWEKWFIAKPGTEDMRLSGRYQSIGGGGRTSLGGSVMVAAWSNYRFSSDGTVTSDQGSGGGTPNVSVLSQQAPNAQPTRFPAIPSPCNTATAIASAPGSCAYPTATTQLA